MHQNHTESKITRSMMIATMMIPIIDLSFEDKTSMRRMIRTKYKGKVLEEMHQEDCRNGIKEMIKMMKKKRLKRSK